MPLRSALLSVEQFQFLRTELLIESVAKLPYVVWSRDQLSCKSRPLWRRSCRVTIKACHFSANQSATFSNPVPVSSTLCVPKGPFSFVSSFFSWRHSALSIFTLLDDICMRSYSNFWLLVLISSGPRLFFVIFKMVVFSEWFNTNISCNFISGIVTLW
jgi:hypothetical protein